MTNQDLSAPSGTALSPLAWRRAWLDVDSNPQALTFVQSPLGMLALHGVFIFILAAGLQLSLSSLALISLTLIAIAIVPAYRLPIIVSSSLFYLLVRPFRIDGWKDLLHSKAEILPFSLPPMALQGVAVGLFLAIAAGYLFWQKNHLNNSAAKRPVLYLMGLWFALLTMAWMAPSGSLTSAVLWSVTGVWISSFWFLAYAAVDQKSKDNTPTLARAGWMRPFWGGSATPIGKGFGYLNKFDAKNPEELAQTRLKALKLAVWTLLLIAVARSFEWVLRGQLSVPELQSAVLAHAAESSFGNALNWASLVSNYFLDLLIIAIWGHTIVAIVRMVGYRIPRNTRNPLASRTLAEFWNRYFFYFKELLVDFFFYPAFLRYFKKNTKLRIAFATLCAAALGNFLYHFTRETYVFASLPLTEALSIFQSAVFYSLALAAGLIISQWRGVKLKPEDGFIRYEVLPRINVFAFFCFLKIFDDITGEGTLSERMTFTLSLFGI